MGHTNDTIAARRQLAIQAREDEPVSKVAMRDDDELHLVPFRKTSPMPHRHRDVEHRLELETSSFARLRVLSDPRQKLANTLNLVLLISEVRHAEVAFAFFHLTGVEHRAV